MKALDFTRMPAKEGGTIECPTCQHVQDHDAAYLGIDCPTPWCGSSKLRYRCDSCGMFWMEDLVR